MKGYTLNLKGAKTHYVEHNLLNNYWLTGFIMGDGCFGVEVQNKQNDKLPKTRVKLQITKKTDDLLLLVKACFGGGVYYCKSIKCYQYSTASLASIAMVIDYLDQHPPFGSSLQIYRFWRKIFFMHKEGVHLTQNGINAIKLFKNKISLIKNQKLCSL